MDHGEFPVRVRREEPFLAMVEPDEGVKEGCCAGGEVHYVVVEGEGLDQERRRLAG